LPQSAASLNDPGWLSTWGNNGVPLFGENVSNEVAMAVAAAYRCVSLISGIIASLDPGIYQDDDNLGRVAVTNRLTRLFTVTPFPGRRMTSFIWKDDDGPEHLAARKFLYGHPL
jgi:phage portal protein BeeE